MKNKEFTHSVILLFLCIFCFIVIMINQIILINLVMVLGLLYLLIKNGFNKSQFKISFGYAILLSPMLFLMKVFYPSTSFQTGEVIHFLNFSFYKVAIIKAIFKSQQFFFIAFISVSSGFVLDYEKIILFLTEKKIISVVWGYALISAINSIIHFQKEFKNIQTSIRLRGLPTFKKLQFFFPLLVFAIKESDKKTFALQLKNLNENKSYYFDLKIPNEDWGKLIGFTLMILSLVKFIQKFY